MRRKHLEGCQIACQKSPRLRGPRMPPCAHQTDYQTDHVGEGLDSCHVYLFRKILQDLTAMKWSLTKGRGSSFEGRMSRVPKNVEGRHKHVEGRKNTSTRGNWRCNELSHCL